MCPESALPKVTNVRNDGLASRLAQGVLPLRSVGEATQGVLPETQAPVRRVRYLEAGTAAPRRVRRPVGQPAEPVRLGQRAGPGAASPVRQKRPTAGVPRQRPSAGEAGKRSSTGNRGDREQGPRSAVATEAVAPLGKVGAPSDVVHPWRQIGVDRIGVVIDHDFPALSERPGDLEHPLPVVVVFVVDVHH